MIVIGLGFGDEGKGLTTSYLCSKVKNPVVVRFNGGHQAGHTVIHKGRRHVFSSFGSGTLQGASTYWSKYCTVHPSAFMNELDRFWGTGILPKITMDPMCPVTTPYDVTSNHSQELMKRHGSVGVGFGTTIARQEAGYKLHVMDLFHPAVMMAKLQSIARYYESPVQSEELQEYLKAVEDMLKFIDVDWHGRYLEAHKEHLIFEGAQGVLLDMDHGFFPNVTRSNTTCKNALSLMDTNQEVYYVTRCYQTRHGNGFMSNEKPLELMNNSSETNVLSKWQGEFRIGELDRDLLVYALKCDRIYAKDRKVNLVITCCDQLPGWHEDRVLNLAQHLKKYQPNLSGIYMSTGPQLEDIKQIA